MTNKAAKQSELVKKLAYIKMMDTGRLPSCLNPKPMAEKFASGEFNIVELDCVDSYMDYTPDNYKSWSTFDKCRELSLSLSGDKLECKISIWNGEPLRGTRKNKRLFAKFTAPISLISDFESRINYDFEVTLREEYKAKLKAKENAFIKNRAKDILGD